MNQPTMTIEIPSIQQIVDDYGVELTVAQYVLIMKSVKKHIEEDVLPQEVQYWIDNQDELVH
jgi:hypothetical protein